MLRTTLAAIGLTAGTAVTLSLANGATAAAAATPSHRATPAAPSGRPAAGATAASLDADVTTATTRRHRRVGTTVVRPGEGFWTIAARTHVDWNALAAANGMTLATMLYPGETLRLPGRTAAATPAAATPAATPATVTTPAVTPATVPSASATSVTPGSAFESCVIERESGGNPEIRSASGYWGLYQFSYATWVAYGGDPAAFGSASAGVQQQVFDRALAAGGESNWAPYDGC